MKVRPLESADVEGWAELRGLLWPGCEPEDSHSDWEHIRLGRDDCGQPCAVFLAERKGQLVGFVDVTLRAYADGCETTPVGYLEGWFVRPEARRQGVGQALLAAAEEWARQQGCSEMASDTELGNKLSQDAHKKLGYEVVEVIVQLRKDLT